MCNKTITLLPITKHQAPVRLETQSKLELELELDLNRKVKKIEATIPLLTLLIPKIIPCSENKSTLSNNKIIKEELAFLKAKLNSLAWYLKTNEPTVNNLDFLNRQSSNVLMFGDKIIL